MDSVLLSFRSQGGIQTPNRMKKVIIVHTTLERSSRRVSQLTQNALCCYNSASSTLPISVSAQPCPSHTSLRPHVSLLLRLVDARSRTSVALRPSYHFAHCCLFEFAGGRPAHARGPEASDAPDSLPAEPEPEPEALPAGAPLPAGLRVVRPASSSV